MTDPIADMLTIIRNAYAVGKKEVVIPHSKLKEAIAKVMQQEKYLESVEVEDTKPQKTIKAKLHYIEDMPVLTKISRISKPGRRVYTTAQDIRNVLSGTGISIISTSQGVMTNNEARAKNVGGEIICKIW